MEKGISTSLFEKKFELWNKKLLDLSKKNRLLNYRQRKTGSYILEDDIDEAYKSIINGAGLLFDIYSEDYEDQQAIDSRNRKLDYIRKQIKSGKDELGFNIGYVAFGMLQWSETGDLSKKIESPLILVPIQIQREDLLSPISIYAKEDEEIVVNPVLLKKLFDDFGVALSEDFDFYNLEISEILTSLKEEIVKLGWTISEKVIVDTFNFQNLVIQKDLERNKLAIQNNPFIKAIVGEEHTEAEKLFDEYSNEIDLKSEKSKNSLQILDADSSQQEAISRARRGDSFVLQGPPGTGKSQTISNIIAEQLGMGKKILFVSEKQAALDVVYNKLHEKGLSDFLLTLHNTKQKKGEIRSQLEKSCKRSEKSLTFKAGSLSLYDNLDFVTHELNEYDTIVHKENNRNYSFYQLHGELSKVLDSQDVLFEVDDSVLILNYERMKDLFEKVDKLGSSYITNSLRFKDNGWKYLKGELSYTKLTEIKELFSSLKNSNISYKTIEKQIQEILPNAFSLQEIKAMLSKFYTLIVNKKGQFKSCWLELNLPEIIIELQEDLSYRKQIADLKQTIKNNEFQIKDVFEEEFLDTENVDQLVKILKYEYNSLFKRLFSNEYKNIFKKNNYSQISSLSTNEINRKIANFKQFDRSILDIARDRIEKSLVDRLPNLNENLRATQGEISILRKELSKKTRLMPTRKLIQQLPTLLPLLKPCIMMSPLTVSTYFLSNSDWKFDLVIFDEASQVKTEYAIAAISRAKQIIVAGDSKQMPPTAFFDSSNESDEFNEEDNDIEDLESILDELKAKIPETYLNWHYRSKDESLITFSNCKFYNNRLYTFPSENSDPHSNVKFEYVPNGLWETKSGNSIEAEYVAKLVKEIAINYPKKTVGVVAFGMSQAQAIEDKIIKMRQENPRLESFFDENRTESFFIKNLENVQGDERDIIILSVGYGKSPDGKIRMNFGPLTKTGGERRLNVAVSRAKEKMYVVSSMKGTDIAVEAKTNPNRIIFRDFLEFAEKGAGALVGYDNTDESRNVEFDSDFEENVYDYLVSQGYKVHTQVGASGYKIDMAVLHPTIHGRYVLAIECDGAAYHSSKTARDRDRLRQEILESKGWKFHRIWSTTWIHENTDEKKNLLDAIEKAISDYSKGVDSQISNEIKTVEASPETVLEEGGKSYLISSDRTETEEQLLPRYHGDVYDFQSDISGLSDIIMKIAKNYIGYNTSDVMRHINSKVFGKVRLTQGYRKVYNRAFNRLVREGRMEITGDIIQSAR